MAASGAGVRNADASVDTSRWLCVYPQYIDAKKTIPEGRRIPVDKAVINPTIGEMADCLNFLKLPFLFEPNKRYSRDWMVPGRVKVNLKSADGSCINPNIATRQALYLELGRLVPKHPRRQGKDSGQSNQQGPSQGGQSGGKGKGGKKKR
eukprot:jgi/Chlat1/3138/Chrsp21S03364